MALRTRSLRLATRPMAKARCFSTSPAPLKSGVATLVTAVKRVMNNAERMAKYEKELQLFPAGRNPAALWWTMVQLHMPAETQVELQEFLAGAKMAAELQLKAVNSKEFAEFAAGLVSQSATADELRDYCTPRFFESIKQAAAGTLKHRNMTLELQEISIEDAVVADVQYAQLTETEYDAQVAGLTTLPLFWSDDASVEYMQIHVTTRSTETTKMTLIGQEECLALQDNSRTWTFGSRVGSPDELDWRIVDTTAANNAAKQLSRTVYADEAAADDTVALGNERK